MKMYRHALPSNICLKHCGLSTAPGHDAGRCDVNGANDTRTGRGSYRNLMPWVESFGTRLLRKHGLTDWRLMTKPLYRAPHEGDCIGRCHYRQKQIVISTEWTQSRYTLRRVILHEIAHALAGPDAGHGPAWQAKARTLGLSNRHVRLHSLLSERGSVCRMQRLPPNRQL